MNRRHSLKLIGGGLAVATFGDSRQADAVIRRDGRPNIVLIVVDDLRWDEFGAGGHPYLKTPYVDRLAKEGATFTRAIHTTLLVRYPAKVAPGMTLDALVSSIDIAPSILELAGTQIGSHVQGRSFASLLDGGQRGGQRRSEVLIENFSDDRPMPWVLDANYKAIRTERHKFIHWIQHPEFDELYDLQVDPREERNLIQDPDCRPAVAALRDRLAQLVRESIAL